MGQTVTLSRGMLAIGLAAAALVSLIAGLLAANAFGLGQAADNEVPVANGVAVPPGAAIIQLRFPNRFLDEFSVRTRGVDLERIRCPDRYRAVPHEISASPLSDSIYTCSDSLLRSPQERYQVIFDWSVRLNETPAHVSWFYTGTDPLPSQPR